MSKPTLSVIIPTLNVAQSLAATIASLEVGKSKFNMEIVVTDGGSTDETLNLSKTLDLKVVCADRGRGTQMAAGVKASQGEWIIFLHADTLLEAGWVTEVSEYLKNDEAKKYGAYFKFSLNDNHPKAVRMADVVAWRARVFGLPYGDQGFFINRKFLNELGGISEIPLMEDVDLVRRIGRRNLHAFKTKAVTSAARYLKSGYYRRASFHIFCLCLYLIGVPVKFIYRIYG